MKKRGKRNYYADDEMSPEGLLELARAEKVVGLGDEIALVRRQVKLVAKAGSRTQRKARQDLRSIASGAETVMRLVTADQRLAPRLREEASGALRQLFDQLGEQILPADG